MSVNEKKEIERLNKAKNTAEKYEYILNKIEEKIEDNKKAKKIKKESFDIEK
jgi:hypothetical protein